MAARPGGIEVRARPGDLSDSDLGFLDILHAVQRATSVAGAGFIDTDAQRVLIEPHGQTLTADDVALGQIQTPGADPVRIGDVSDVVEAPAPAFGDALIMGKPGVLVDVASQYGANMLQTTQAVEDALSALKPALAAQGVTVRTDLDRPAGFAVAAMRGIAWDLGIGAVLVAIVLALFMRDLRATLISLISIPLSLLAAVMALKAFGWSLNAMTLGGLAVGLGVVIDDAVIDVENILDRLARGRGAATPRGWKPCLPPRSRCAGRWSTPPWRSSWRWFRSWCSAGRKGRCWRRWRRPSSPPPWPRWWWRRW